MVDIVALSLESSEANVVLLLVVVVVKLLSYDELVDVPVGMSSPAGFAAVVGCFLKLCW